MDETQILLDSKFQKNSVLKLLLLKMKEEKAK